jgi:hypothetical protein
MSLVTGARASTRGEGELEGGGVWADKSAMGTGYLARASLATTFQEGMRIMTVIWSILLHAIIGDGRDIEL